MAKDKILETLADHGKRLTNIEKDMVTKTEFQELRQVVSKKFQEHDDRFDKVDESMVGLRNDMLTHFDKQLVILQRLDQERVVTNHRLDRLEAKVGVDEG